VKGALESAALKIEEAELAMIPQTTTEVSVDLARPLIRLIDALDDNDDVQKVYHNALVPDEALQDA
jgi:transcriptional/translational regulatory protein YebC/TACO1